MKLKAQVEGLAIPATVVTADLPKDTLVAVTADATVDKCAADGFPIGRLSVPAKLANTQGTVETKFKELVEMEADGAINAGDWVKLGALSPTTGKHTAKVWTEGTASADNDPIKRAYGVAWVGGADEAIVQVLTF
jgi:hypothetical protein